MTVRFAPDIAAMRRLVAVARRSQPADLVVTSGALLDVYTEEILEGWGLVIAEGRVAYAGPDVEKFESAARIEGRGHVIAPGLVEGHTHLFRMGLGATVPLQVAAGGATTVFEASSAPARSALPCSARTSSGKATARFEYEIPAPSAEATSARRVEVMTVTRLTKRAAWRPTL